MYFAVKYIAVMSVYRSISVYYTIIHFFISFGISGNENQPLSLFRNNHVDPSSHKAIATKSHCVLLVLFTPDKDICIIFLSFISLSPLITGMLN
jgi:hypothetical protein